MRSIHIDYVTDPCASQPTASSWQEAIDHPLEAGAFTTRPA